MISVHPMRATFINHDAVTAGTRCRGGSRRRGSRLAEALLVSDTRGDPTDTRGQRLEELAQVPHRGHEDAGHAFIG